LQVVAVVVVVWELLNLPIKVATPLTSLVAAVVVVVLGLAQVVVEAQVIPALEDPELLVVEEV
jgi:hypothetical protein